MYASAFAVRAQPREPGPTWSGTRTVRCRTVPVQSCRRGCGVWLWTARGRRRAKRARLASRVSVSESRTRLVGVERISDILRTHFILHPRLYHACYCTQQRACAGPPRLYTFIHSALARSNLEHLPREHQRGHAHECLPHTVGFKQTASSRRLLHALPNVTHRHLPECNDRSDSDTTMEL